MEEKVTVVIVVITLLLAIISRWVKDKMLQNIYENTGKQLGWGKAKAVVASLGILIPVVAVIISLNVNDWNAKSIFLGKTFGLPTAAYFLIGIAILIIISIRDIGKIDRSSSIVLTLVQAYSGILVLATMILFVFAFLISAASEENNTGSVNRKAWDDDEMPTEKSDRVARRYGFRDADDAYNHGYDSYAVGDSRSYTKGESRYKTKIN